MPAVPISAVAIVAIAGTLACCPGAAQVLQDCAECPDLVPIPAGTFEMGSTDGEAGRDEGPVRRVTIIRAFALGRTEVTRGQFAHFVAASGYQTTPGCRTFREGRWIDDPSADWRNNGLDSATPDLPVTCVSWRDAQVYLEWLSERTGYVYRLPSEAEWEYAAAAGRRTAWPWGNNPDNACGSANLYDRDGRGAHDFGWAHADCNDGAAGAASVGRYLRNAFGLSDMIGNVWEWTQDCYSEGYIGAPVDGSAHAIVDCPLRSVRGGSWMTRPSRARFSFRGRDPETRRLAYFGFRVARDLSDDVARERRPAAGIEGIHRVSVVVPDADAVIALLRDTLGLAVTRDAPLESLRARRALGVDDDDTLRFVTIAPASGGDTSLGLLEIGPPQSSRSIPADAIVVLSVRGLDALIGRVRAAGFAVSDAVQVAKPGPAIHVREASIAGPGGMRVILQERAP